jgi:hypothetical protein
LLRPSEYLRFEVDVRAPSDEALQQLFLLDSDEDIGLEDWGTIRCLCSARSRKSPGPYERDKAIAADPADGPIGLAAAAPDEGRLLSLLEVWAASQPGRSVLRIASLVPRQAD